MKNSEKALAEAIRSIGNAEPSLRVRHRIVAGAIRRLRRRSNHRFVFQLAMGTLAMVFVIGSAIFFVHRNRSIETSSEKKRSLSANLSKTEPHAEKIKSTTPPRKERELASNGAAITRPRDFLNPTKHVPMKQTAWQTQDRDVRFVFGKHRISLMANTDLRRRKSNVAQMDLVLNRGTAEFSVDPLRLGETFSVSTPHAAVFVVGTQFRVATDRLCSRVTVTHGAVEVVPHTGAAVSVRAPASQTFCSMNTKESYSAEELLFKKTLDHLSQKKYASKGHELLKQYLSRYPAGLFHEDALFHLICYAFTQGSSQVARELTQDFISRYPNSPRVKQIRELIENK